MRKMFSAVLCVVLIAGLSGVALARETMSVETRVAVNVAHTVTVGVLAPASTPVIEPAVEDAVIRVGFQVDANSQMLRLGAAASKLWKGDVPNSQYYLDNKGGVRIVCDFANPLNGVSNIAVFGPSTTIGIYPGLSTNGIIFESSQNNRFSQACYLRFTWTTTDSELPTGQYSGMVRFTGTIYPAVN